MKPSEPYRRARERRMPRKPSRFECMCVVCHGPLELKNSVTASTCSEACHYYWHHYLKPFGTLGFKYEALRWTHQYRREQMAVLAWIEALVDGRLLVEVRAELGRSA